MVGRAVETTKRDIAGEPVVVPVGLRVRPDGEREAARESPLAREAQTLLPDHRRVRAHRCSSAASARKSPTLPPVMATRTSNVMGTPEESVPAAG